VDIVGLGTGQLLIFLLVLTRISGVFFLAPIFGSSNIPTQVKIGLSLMTSLVVLPFIAGNVSPNMHIVDFALLLAKELTVGAIIGFTATLVFMGILLAGQIIDIQMGFGMVNVVDPLSNISVSIMGQFKNLLAMLVFLAINGHHFLFTALTKSFEIVPLTTFELTPSITENFIGMVVNMFVIGLKIGGPAIGVLLITDFALGIIARTVPQMNVFIVGMPLKITIGFITIISMLSLLLIYFSQIMGQMPEQLIRSIK
jgi:flagellar biosynthetic protein FliR